MARAHRLWARTGAVVVAIACVGPAALVPVTAAGAADPVAPGPGPSSLVDTFAGTGSGGGVVGTVDTFPGADLPFGMVQWSPDTYPDRPSGGGYAYTATEISGFSLTHLSGAGCSVFGDVPVLPTTGAVPSDPETAAEPFSHSEESASPGRYQVAVGSPAVTTRLSVTTRSGIGTFTFPATAAANLLFKVSGSASGIHASAVRTVGSDEIEGTVQSGYFCTTLENYDLHFVAVFNRPFTAHGTWTKTGLKPGSRSCSGTFEVDCGAWVTFDTTATPTVEMKVGISYVSAANAAANLKAEDPGWSLPAVEAKATRAWDAALGRIAVSGGTTGERQLFYTALYHSLLDPSTFSDANGEYEGFDGRVHRTGGRVQYANYSEWDIYRSEVPLLSMVDPHVVSDMMQSLVNDAVQSGWLPVWEVANGDSGTMNGDSGDPVVAGAYAFGVRGFDVASALKYMLKGAERPGTGPNEVEERPNLTTFEKLGYVPATDVDPSSATETIGASETLEYSLDDFTVAQLASALGDRSQARTMMAAAQHWQELYNPATGYVQARRGNGSFPAGPAMQYLPFATIFQGFYQTGFAEGNAPQYTWSVPQDLSGLFALMGGDAAATTELDTFFTQLNAGPWRPYDWSGNEPDLWVPWEFDYSGAPWRTQATVRAIADTEYSLTPAGEPGNDDLGAMSSWYVWAALGLYPLTPGTADLVVSSPIFPEATIHLQGHEVLRIVASGTPDAYVASATVAAGRGRAVPLDRPYLSPGILRTGGTVRFTLSATPDKTWGASPADAPPSYTTQAAPAVGFTLPSGEVDAAAGVAHAVTLGAQSGSAKATTVSWRVTSAKGVRVTPSSGHFALPAESSDGTFGRATTTLEVTASGPGTHLVHVALSAPGHAPLPPVTLVVKA